MITLSLLKNRMLKNGSPLQSICGVDDLIDIASLQAGVTKDNLPALMTYTGVRGTFSGSNVFFIDIDTTDGVESVISNLSDLFICCNNVRAIQKSYSGKLHIIGVMDKIYTDENEWSHMCKVYTAWIVCVIKKIYNIDYFPAIDHHSMKWSQLLYISANKFYFNPNPNLSCGTKAYYDTIISIAKELGWFDGRSKVSKSTEYAPTYNYINTPINGDKITIDRNFCLGSWTGNDVRWRMGSTICNMIGVEAGKEFIYNHFNNPREYFNNTLYGVYDACKNWLLETFPEEFQLKDDVKKNISQDTKIITWMSDVADEIIDALNTYGRIEVVAPTGSGKTTLINNILTKELNPVIIVPFNTTNQLYNNCVIVGTDGTGEYTTRKPCCMVWDQAMKYDFKDRVVIVDESHELFLSRTYRSAAVKLMKKLQNAKKLISLSATPTGEVDELGLHQINYYKNRGLIDFDFIRTNMDPGMAMLGQIMYNQKSHVYDRVVVFSDSHVRKLMENLLAKDVFRSDITYMHSDNKCGEDFKSLKTTELMSTPIVLCTSIAYNGLNFKNENEKILVLLNYKEGETVSSKVIQAIGRIRNSNVHVKCYERVSDKEKNTKTPVEELIQRADFCFENDLDSKLFTHNADLVEEDNKDARLSIDRYYQMHATYDCFINELKSTGYIALTECEVEANIDGTLHLPIKRTVSDVWKSDFINQTISEEYKSNPYYIELTRLLHDILRNFECCSIDFVRDYIKNDIKNTMAWTLLNNIDFIFRSCTMSTPEYKRIKGVCDLAPSYYKKEMDASMSKITKCRKKYGTVDRHAKLDTNILDDLFNENTKYLKAKSKAGKKGMKSRWGDE